MNAELTRQLIELVERAGDAILEIYQTDFSVDIKADDSPLTQADLAAHRIIAAELADLTPEIPLLSEESTLPSYEERQSWSRYWLVDPLDGTKEFVNRNGEFTVNIALIDEHHPVFGVVGVPVRGLVYTGDVDQGEAYCFRDGTRERLGGRAMGDDQALVVVASRSHGGERLEAYIDALGKLYPEVSRTPVGSSLKLCLLAEGNADLYPRLGPTSEWDIAAAHAVLVAAGGELWAVDGSALTYNGKKSFLNPEFFAVADGSYPWREHLPPVA
ncbi:MAG: 3'(2'),5'-bisphosphate nucleotidase CysQ [Gammaproteobacteria bacterium]|nr:3'(2'),5'-bisphosphate nucleotidase CysQ [Gammaproteobacteria bacterium]